MTKMQFRAGDRVVHTLGRRGTVTRGNDTDHVTVAVRFDNAARASSVHERYIQPLPADRDLTTTKEHP